MCSQYKCLIHGFDSEASTDEYVGDLSSTFRLKRQAFPCLTLGKHIHYSIINLMGEIPRNVRPSAAGSPCKSRRTNVFSLTVLMN